MVLLTNEDTMDILRRSQDELHMLGGRGGGYGGERSVGCEDKEKG